MNIEARLAFRIKALTAAIAFAAIQSPAHSQDTGDSLDPALIEEVIVTATKRGGQNLTEVAAGISVVQGDEIDAANVGRLQDFLQKVPSVAVDVVDAGRTSINIRGVNTTFGASSVGYYVDDLPFSFIRFNLLPDLQPYDLQSVEVLRGPQGTLYGAGSAGGVIILNTSDPDLAEFGIKGQGSLSTIENGGQVYTVSGSVNVPIVEDKLALRLTTSYRDNGGWIDGSVNQTEDINDSENTIYRAKLLWAASDRLEIEGIANISRFEAGANNIADDSMEFPDLTDLSGYADYDQFGVVVNYDTDWFTLRNATSVLDFDSEYLVGFSEIFRAPTQQTLESFVNELRLVSHGDSAFSWVAGFFYRDSKESTVQDLTSLGQGLLIEDVESVQTMVYGEGTYSLVDGLVDITAGLSYFQDEVDASGSFGFSLGESDAIEPDIWSPKLAVSFYPRENSTVYGSYSKGFRTALHDFRLSTFSANAAGLAIDGEVDEEIHSAFEVGYKADFWGGRIFLDVAAFYTEIEDVQQSLAFPIPGADIAVTAVLNAGEAESTGIEWNLEVDLSESWSFTTSGSYVKAEIVEDFFGPGSTEPDFNAGDSLNLIPELSLSASLSYFFDLGNASGQVTGGVQHTSSRSLIQHAQAPVEGDDVTRMDLRAEVTRGNWTLFGFVNNLTDDDGLISPSVIQGTFDAVGQPYDGALGGRWQPRTFGIGLRGSL